MKVENTGRSIVTVDDLELGDIINLEHASGGYDTATVQQVTDREVKVIRPYIHCADFSTTAGVITYIGFEEFKLYKGSQRQVLLVERLARALR